MKRIGYACCLLLTIQFARGQVSTSGDLRPLSARWAVYYATVHRVPIELVEAIIDRFRRGGLQDVSSHWYGCYASACWCRSKVNEGMASSSAVGLRLL